MDGLGAIGVLGMTGPTEFGGLGFTQQQYCKVLEVIGGHDAAVGVFVNAHGSIGILRWVACAVVLIDVSLVMVVLLLWSRLRTLRAAASEEGPEIRQARRV